MVALARELNRPRIGSRAARHRHRDLLPGQQRALEPHGRSSPSFADLDFAQGTPPRVHYRSRWPFPAGSNLGRQLKVENRPPVHPSRYPNLSVVVFNDRLADG